MLLLGLAILSQKAAARYLSAISALVLPASHHRVEDPSVLEELMCKA